jgi:hypothetical protein
MYIRLQFLKGTVRPYWICMGVYHWIGIEKDINRFRFFIFILDLEYLIRVQSSKPLHAKMNHGLHVLKPRYFPPNRAPKMREKHKLFFGLCLVNKESQHPEIQTKIEQHFGGFFHRIKKVCQPIERQDSMQTVIQTSRRLDSFFA